MSTWRALLPFLGPRRPRIFLHIGAMKTGTTYLQDLMSANREQLRAAGVLFPGARWQEQSAAAGDVLGFNADDADRAEELAGAWDAMVQQMMGWRGKASVFSMEFLSFADEEQAARIVESLEGADVHVVITVRDAAASIPAQWQTICRNGGKVAFRKFVYGVKEALDSGGESPERPVRILMRTQGIGRMLDVWVPLVGADHVHVVTVPPKGSDPDLLWRRFASVVKVRPSVCTQPVETSNPSLGHASTELLRRVNVALGRLSRADQTAVLKGPLARQILGPRAPLEKSIRLHRRGHAFARRWNREVRAAIEASGANVVGSLEDLPADKPPLSIPKTLYRPSPAELLAAAETAREGLLAFQAELAEEVIRFGAEPVLTTGTEAPETDDGSAPYPGGGSDIYGDSDAGDDEDESDDDSDDSDDSDHEGDSQGSGRTSEPGAADPEREMVRAAVREVASLARSCMNLHRQFRTLRRAQRAATTASGAGTAVSADSA
jgi:hypothetical protein